jgi:signal transduction histidine kinase/ActR/RegA family two-component response regulator
MATRAIRLEHAFAAAITLLAVALTGILSYTLGRAAVSRVEAEIGGRLATLAAQMQDKLDRGLFERYREITNAASLLPLFDTSASPDARERLLDQLRATFGEYAWIGYADRNGRVVSATDGFLVGSDLSGTRTFRNAIQAPTIGEVHSVHVPGSGEDGIGRVIDVAAPVVDFEGETIGFLVAYLSWNWAEEIKDSLFGHSPKPGVEVLVLAPSGDVLMGPQAYADQKLDLPSVKAAMQGQNRASVETWPDGHRYVTGFAKSDGYRSFPGLGWMVLVREDAELALAPAANLQRHVIALALGAILLASFAAWVLADKLAAPLIRLSVTADRLRRGEPVEIKEERAYAEASVLANSLRSLVVELQARQAKLAELNASLENEVRQRTSELASQNVALAKAKETAEQATAAKSRFLAAASHDLRQPLHALLLFARALSRRVQGEEATRLVRQMEEALASLRGMFDGLLNISRLDAGLVTPDVKPVPLGEMTARLAAGFQAEAQARGLRFLSRPLDATVETDPVILETMVRNLVANALKFTKAGGVALAVRSVDGRIAIEITDTGPGIAPSEAAAVFDEFHRARHQATGPNEGLGLGLSIVARYARLLGIEVRLASRPGRGTRVRLLMTPAQATAVEVAEPPRTIPPPAVLPARILVVDDEPLIVAALVRELTDIGHRAVGCETTAEAEKVLLNGARFDATIVDHHLGGPETGDQFITRMEAMLAVTLPTLILSGGTDAATLAALTRSGRPFLTKPADARAIAAALSSLLHERTAPAATRPAA